MVTVRLDYYDNTNHCMAGNEFVFKFLYYDYNDDNLLSLHGTTLQIILIQLEYYYISDIDLDTICLAFIIIIISDNMNKSISHDDRKIL